MDKSIALQRSAATGRFMTKPLGKAKAEKFAKVEGVTTSSWSAALLSTYSERGLKGDTLRSAIMGSFVGKKGQ